MKIGIDCSKAVNEKAGIARYTWEIAAYLPKLFPKDSYFYYFNFMRKEGKKNELIKKLVGKNKNVSYKIYRIPGLFKEKLFSSPISISNYWLRGMDLVHATEFLSFDQGLNVPQILTVHDLSMIRFPEHRGKEAITHGKILERASEKADAIISVSQSTKNDIIKYFHISPDKINVVYSGFNSNFKKIDKKNNLDKILKKYNIKIPYILFVGTIEPRKNITNLILAFSKFALSEAGKDYNLYLVGKKGWNTSEIEKTYNKSPVRNKIVFLNYVPDEDLVYLYNGTSLFCYPSIYEGFGLPPLEAMACGAPVLVSNVSSLPEIVGKAGELVDPESYLSIYRGMEKILTNKKISDEMRDKSISQAKMFSWEKCAKETRQIYEKVLKNEE